jgi:hypothetical protein
MPIAAKMIWNPSDVAIWVRAAIKSPIGKLVPPAKLPSGDSIRQEAEKGCRNKFATAPVEFGQFGRGFPDRAERLVKSHLLTKQDAHQRENA